MIESKKRNMKQEKNLMKEKNQYNIYIKQDEDQY